MSVSIRRLPILGEAERREQMQNGYHQTPAPIGAHILAPDVIPG
jgi:hypothetical protein